MGLIIVLDQSEGMEKQIEMGTELGSKGQISLPSEEVRSPIAIQKIAGEKID